MAGYVIYSNGNQDDISFIHLYFDMGDIQPEFGDTIEVINKRTGNTSTYNVSSVNGVNGELGFGISKTYRRKKNQYLGLNIDDVSDVYLFDTESSDLIPFEIEYIRERKHRTIALSASSFTSLQTQWNKFCRANGLNTNCIVRIIPCNPMQYNVEIIHSVIRIANALFVDIDKDSDISVDLVKSVVKTVSDALRKEHTERVIEEKINGKIRYKYRE